MLEKKLPNSKKRVLLNLLLIIMIDVVISLLIPIGEDEGEDLD